MNNILVSIIIPTYNVESYIFRGLESCINQTYKNIEIIIIDDGSTDKTRDIIKRYSEKDNRIKYFFQKNKGVSSARNKGLDISGGEYIIFLDSDDWLELNTVEYLLEKKSNNKDCFIICDRYFAYLDLDDSIFKERQNEDENEIILSNKEILLNVGTKKYNLQSSCYKLFSKKILNNNIRFKEDIYHGEDGLFVFEYLFFVQNVFYINKPLWNILERTDSSSRGKFNKKFFTAITAVKEMIKLAENDKELKEYLKKYLYIRTKQVFFKGIKDKGLNIEEERLLKKQIIELEKLYFEDLNIMKKIKFYFSIRIPKILIRFLLNIRK